MLAPGTQAQTRPTWLSSAPDVVDQTVFGLLVWQWIGLACVAAIAFVVSLVGRFIVILGLRARGKYQYAVSR